MRLLIRSIFVLMVLAVLAVGAITFLVPEDVVRDRAIGFVKQQTGRTLTIRGKTSFAFYPSIGVELGDVTLSGPPEMKGGPVLRMASLTLNLKLLPLLSRNVEIERFVLQRPVFDLRVDAEGRRNWDFARGRARDRARAPAATDPAPPAAPKPDPAAAPAQSPAPPAATVQRIRLGMIRIQDGIVLYSNERTGVRRRVDAVNLSLTQDRLADPLDAEGDAVWEGEKVAFKGKVGSPTALARGGPSAVTLNLSSRHGKGAFTGRVALGDALAADGDLVADTGSLRALAAWTGNPLPPGKGLGPAAYSGRVKYQGELLAFTNTRFSLDGMKGQGNGTLTLKKGARPYLRAAFAIDQLNLNAWMGPAVKTPDAPAPDADRPQQPAPRQQPKSQQKPGQSLTDFIEQLDRKDVKPQVRGWSQRAFDFAGLKLLDADVNVNAGALLYKEIKVANSAVSTSLRNGVLTANLTRIDLYGGTGTGRVTLNSARDVPALAVTFDLKGVSALPLLTDAIDFDWISGKANLVINLSGAGRAQNEMVGTLQGTGNVAFTDGAIQGINIPAMVRGLKKGKLSGWKSDKREKTEFSSLTGTFTMQNGVATNPDLNLVGPLIRMSGTGVVNVPGERIDFSLKPQIVASLEGQGNTEKLQGLVIPVRVHGPWKDPKVKPDLDKMLDNPDEAKDAAKKIYKDFKENKKISGKDVERLLKGVLGDDKETDKETGQQPEKDGEEPTTKQKARDFLKQFLR